MKNHESTERQHYIQSSTTMVAINFEGLPDSNVDPPDSEIYCLKLAGVETCYSFNVTSYLDFK